MFCPYINNKQVTDGFNEMVLAFGGKPMTKEEFKSSSLRNLRTGLDYSAMDLAYEVYDRNNGNFLDKTPSGEQSELFNRLVSATGDRSAAILLKSKIYSDAFRRAYGDVAEKGEPKYNTVFKSIKPELSKTKLDFSTVSIELFSKSQLSLLTSDTVFDRLSKIGVIPDRLEPLLTLLSKHQVPVLLVKLEGPKFMATRTDLDGNSYIVVDPQKVIGISYGYFAEKLLHEIVHVVTVPVIDKPTGHRQKKFSKTAQKLVDLLKDLFYIDGILLNYSPTLEYALSSPKEFVAEFLVNEELRNTVYERAILHKHLSLMQTLKEFINSITRAFIGENLFNTPLSQVIKLESQLKDLLYNKETIQYEGSDIQQMFNEAYESIDYDVIDYENYDRAIDDYTKNLEVFQTNFAPDQSNYSKSAISEINKAFETILEQLTIRLKSLDRLTGKDSSKSSLYATTKDQLAIALSIEMTPGQKILTLLQPILPQILSDYEELKEFLGSDTILTSDQYNYLFHDNLGVYMEILKNIKSLILNQIYGVENGLKKELGEDGYKSLSDFVNKAFDVADSGVNALMQHRALVGKKLMRQYGREVGGADLIEVADLLDTPVEKDTSWFIKSLGFISGSNNKVLQYISGKITKAVNLAEIANKSVGNKLLKLQSKLKFGEKVTMLYERLDDGSFSQNLIRKVNFGQLLKDYSDFRKTLQDKYNLSDSEMMYGPEDPEVRKKFFTDQNKWLKEHTIRRYKSEYYEAFLKLSPKTLAARRSIQAQINEYKRMCTDKEAGRPDYSKLTDQQWDELQTLLQQKKMLASIYDAFGNLKTGELLTTALEIQLLNEALYGNSTARRSNYEAWAKDREKIIEQCGGREKYEAGDESFDFNKLEKWDRRNSRQVLKFNKQLGKSELEIYIDQHAGKVVYELVTESGPDGGAEYNRLTELKNQLLAPYRNNFGEIGIFKKENKDVLPSSVIAQINSIDNQLGKIRRLAKKRAKKNGDKEFLATLERRAELRDNIVEKHTTKAYKDLVKYYRSLHENDPLLAQEIIDRKTRKRIVRFDNDSVDEMYGSLYQWYTRTIVKPEYAELFSELAPNDNYLDDTVKSDLLDDRFDEWADQGEYMVPRTDTPELKKRYDNSKQFNKVDKREGNNEFSQTLYDLYNEAVKVIEESNERYNLPHRSKYLLPGITVSNIGSLYYRDYKTIKALKYIKKNWFGLKEREDSDMFGEKIQKEIETGHAPQKSSLSRPDGTELRMIPKYYSNKLEDPFAVSRNLVEILSRYDKQSRLFKERLAILSEIQLMSDILKDKYAPVRKKNGTSNAYQAAKKHIDRRMYDLKYLGDPRLARLASLVSGLTSAINLGFNAAVALTGFFSTSTAHLINALSGYRYSIKDVVVASVACAGYVAKRLGGFLDFANKNSSNKIILLMEMFDLGNQYEGKIKHSSDTYLMKLFKENWIWGMLKLQDNAVKMSIMIATLNSFRFVDGKFITKEDIIRSNWKDDNARDSKLEDYRSAKTLYELLNPDKNGDIAVSKEYEDAYLKVRDAVINRVLRYAENADGMATESLKAAITTGFLGQAALMHRQYFPLMLQERYGETVYDPEIRQYNGGIFRNAAKLFASAYINMYQRIRGLKKGAITWSLESALNCAMVCGILTFEFGMPIFMATALFSFIAGAINGEEYNKMFKAHKNKLSSERDAQLSITRQYQLKLMRWELAVTQLLIYPIATLITALADSDDDRDNKFLQFMAYVAARTQWETFNPYRMSDAALQFKSVSAVTGTLDKAQAVLYNISKILSPRTDLLDTILPKTQEAVSPIWSALFGDEDNSAIFFSNEKQQRQGTYSVPIPIISDIIGEDVYFTKLGYSLFNFTPFSNTYKQSLNSKRSRLYYRNLIMQDDDYKEEALYQYFDSELVDPINDYINDNE